MMKDASLLNKGIHEISTASPFLIHIKHLTHSGFVMMFLVAWITHHGCIGTTDGTEFAVLFALMTCC